MGKKVVLFLALLFVSLASNYAAAAWGFEIDRITVVSRVIDGDTIVLADGDRVRFGDIDTPETYEAGYQVAKDYVTNMISGKTVYLDIDDFTGQDNYGRLVCVVYVDYNATHYKNLNKALLDANLASIWDFDNNDFNPYLWTLYVPKESALNTATPSQTASPTTTYFEWEGDYRDPNVLIIIIFAIIILFLIVAFATRRENRRVFQKNQTSAHAWFKFALGSDSWIK